MVINLQNYLKYTNATVVQTGADEALGFLSTYTSFLKRSISKNLRNTLSRNCNLRRISISKKMCSSCHHLFYKPQKTACKMSVIR